MTWCFAPTLHPAAGSLFFSGGASSNDQATAQMTFMEAKGWKRATLISTTDATGQDTEGRYVDNFTNGKYPGMTLLTREHFVDSRTYCGELAAASIYELNPTWPSERQAIGTIAQSGGSRRDHLANGRCTKLVTECSHQ